MIEFRHVLCPIDFSDTSVRTLAYASAFATWYDAQLTVLHVTATSGEAAASALAGGVPLASMQDDVLARIRRTIEQAGVTAPHVRPLAQDGLVAERIVEVAAALRPAADLLVMGTHGVGGFQRLLLGSVTEKVVRTARCLVLAVPPPAATPAPDQIAFRKILCPIDYSPSSLKALQYALELGRQADGCVTALSAVEYLDPDDHLEPSVFDPGRQDALDNRGRRQQLVDHARERLQRQLAGEPRTWCEIEEVVAVSRAYKAILQRAAASAIDLIVMGAQGSGGLELMFYGSNTQHVVRAATCPVLTVRA